MARSVLALVACMVLLAPPGSVAQERASADRPQGAEGTHAPTRFDIDAQALATALRAFSEASGTAVLFDDALVADKRSQGIHGEATARDALRVVLLGTGLEARFSAMNAFTVALPDAAPTDVPAMPEPADVPAMDDRTAGLLQSALERALCARVATRPGAFRLAMQVWIDSAGRVANAIALAPSDDPARDDKVLAAVRTVRVPSTLHRFSPVTVLLAPAAGHRCSESGAWEG
ncbi:STN domain-containing protein [Luteibacter yeojuensis]|uniref:Secretin/TonB short N-terminal domain-containing protein n=1 Tax=Luteibacter yeojuensis TaxID=345309 RepID=A0A7X5QT58_9GAMM|nr:STN domain-containing protein [Luteibacter yeojuensis]NID14919.1 hypothetical protein [Luteibacter yeojuensis]